VHRGLRSDPASWTDPRHKQGLAAEEEAIRFLASRGWLVLEHRWRVGRTEIDIVARRGVIVAFIEVKARRGEAFGSPFEAVTGAKRREIVRAARAWVDRFGAPSDIYRFDVIGLSQGVLEHLEDAFRPGWR
jgi:putative endonuclease